MDEKSFKNYSELITLLESRNIDFTSTSSKGTAKKHLQREGYYNLINGYKDMFLDSQGENYKDGTTVEEIYSLYEFDCELRNAIFESILRVETNVKSLISYEFSKAHGHQNYLINSNFRNDSLTAIKQSTELISEAQRQVANRVKDPSINHYLSKYGYVPLWVMNNILTFGTVSKFYSLMLQKERQEVAKVFKIDEKTLESFLFYLSKIRNFCAHGNRLYCYRTQTPISNTPVHENLNIPIIKSEYTYGKRDLFACMIALRMLMSGENFDVLCDRVESAITKLEASIQTISIEDVLSSMGFPGSWKRIKRVSKKKK